MPDPKIGGFMPDGISADPQPDTEKREEEPIGDEYIEQMYHPHPELPESIPEEVVAQLRQTNSYNELSPRMWYLLRSGLGGLLMPAPIWEQAARYFEASSTGEDASLTAGVGTRSGDIGHAFRTMATISDLGTRTMPIEIREHLWGTDPETIIANFRSYLNTYPRIASAYGALVAGVKSKEESLSDEEMDQIDGMRREFSATKSRFRRAEEPGEQNEALNAVLSCARKLSEMENIPWYCYVAELGQQHVERMGNTFESLNDVERVIFNDAVRYADRTRNEVTPYALESMLGEHTVTVREYRKSMTKEK